VKRRRRNPTRTVYAGPSAATLAEAGLIQDVVLVAAEVAGIGLLAWIVWKFLTSGQGTPEQAVSEMLGYSPGPGTALPANTPSGPATPQNTIPNPSTWSGQNPLAPWVQPGPPA
jgi:hypothetical protein